MAKTPEGSVKADIKNYLDHYQIYYHMSVQTGFGRRTVDFLICWPPAGKFVAVEVKRRGAAKRSKGKHPLANRYQEIILEAVERSGGAAIAVDNLKDLENFLINL